MNFTPRPGKDDKPGPKSGLSTFIDPLLATQGEGGKAQKLSIKKLRALGFQTNEEPDGHVGIRPASGKALKAWAASRKELAEGKAPHHLTRLVRLARVGEVRVDKPKTD